METVVQPPADAELHILTQWGDAADSSPQAESGGLLGAGARGSGGDAVHPAQRPVRAAATDGAGSDHPAHRTAHRADPERAQQGQDQQRVQRHRDAPPAAHPDAHGPALRTLPQAPQPAEPKPAPPLPEPPKVEAAVKEVPKTELPQAPPPQIQPVETPKLAFETPSPPPPPLPPGQGRVPVPDTSVSGAIRQAARSGSAGGLVVGDFGAAGPGGFGPGVNLPPSPGSQGSNMQLLTDPQGVDFRPYLMRILASVKQHWLSVMPESVKLGRRGKVAIQFSISREGGVPKLVIAEASGAEALDRAAVAGISASVPFPPLPAEFKGDRIVLQMNFAYNMPRQ
jgi:TonB family protein